MRLRQAWDRPTRPRPIVIIGAGAIVRTSTTATGSAARWRSTIRTSTVFGSWFTEAFEGPMSNLQRFLTGKDRALVSPVEDAIRTMAVVEACYESSALGSTPIPEP